MKAPSLQNQPSMLSIPRRRKLAITRRVVQPNQEVKREAVAPNPPRDLIPNTSLLLRREPLSMPKPRQELLTILVLTRVAP